MSYEIPIRAMLEDETKKVITNEFRQILREELSEVKIDIEDNINNLINSPDGIGFDKSDLLEAEKLIKQKEDNYHTMDELYDHRTLLFALVCTKFPEIAWKSEIHSDGTSEEGWFIAGLETPYGQITYHQKTKYWNLFKCKELDKAPEYDGHTPNHVLTRLSLLIRDSSNV